MKLPFTKENIISKPRTIKRNTYLRSGVANELSIAESKGKITEPIYKKFSTFETKGTLVVPHTQNHELLFKVYKRVPMV